MIVVAIAAKIATTIALGMLRARGGITTLVEAGTSVMTKLATETAAMRAILCVIAKVVQVVAILQTTIPPRGHMICSHLHLDGS